MQKEISTPSNDIKISLSVLNNLTLSSPNISTFTKS